MSIRFSFLLLPAYGLIALGCLARPAQAQVFTVDQADTVSSTNFRDITTFGPMGQSFIPTLTGLNAVELKLYNAQSTLGQVFVNVRQTNVTGAILGTSATTNILTPQDYYRFNFASLVALTPGQTYFLQPVETNTSNVLITGTPTDTYSAGSATGHDYFTIAFGIADLNFREGIVASTPEPCSIALLIGMGVSGAGFLVRRRRRNDGQILKV